MSSKSRFHGTGSVFSFTLRQMLKNKANMISLAVLFLFAVLSMPLQALTGGSSVEMDCTIETVYLSNESGFSLDETLLKEQNPDLSGITIKEAADFDSCRFLLGEHDVYILIQKPDKSDICRMEAHTPENTALRSYEPQELMEALSEQLTMLRYEALGISPEELSELLGNCSVTAYDQAEYSSKDTSMGFDASFAIQYVYSIIVMILCIMASSFIIRSVIEEKDSKLVEFLMVSVEPLALLVGKILAIMIFVLMMIACMAAGFGLSFVISTEFLGTMGPAALLASLGIDLSLMNLGWGTIGVVLISLALAFATYSLLAGLVGSCCSSIEETEPANMTVLLLVMAGYIISCITPALTGSGPLAVFVSLCPVVSVFCAPVLYVCGSIRFWVLALSWVIQALILGVLAVFCAKVYRDLLLYRGSRMKPGQLITLFFTKKKEGTV